MFFQNKAMMTLGIFIFMRKTVPYQSLNRSLSFRQASNNVIGTLPKTQFIGKESETVEISGILMPEITGGKMSVTVLEQMAESGKPFPLIQGDFSILGWYVIENVKINSSEFFSDGSPRKIDFSMNLKRTDESLIAKEIRKGIDVGVQKLESVGSDLLNTAVEKIADYLPTTPLPVATNSTALGREINSVVQASRQGASKIMTTAQIDKSLEKLSVV